MEAILEVKSGKKSSKTIKEVHSIMSLFPTKTIILGCTELPFLIETSDDIVDPMDNLVERIIKKASE